MVAIRLLKTWGGESLSRSWSRRRKKCWRSCRRRVGARRSRRGFAPDFARSHSRSDFDVIHQAVSAQQVLALHYRDEAGKLSQRDVQPLGLFFWGERWLLVRGASCAMIIAVSGSTMSQYCADGEAVSAKVPTVIGDFCAR
jgi:predicted DNA-binding transcriptional regulator YafY